MEPILDIAKALSDRTRLRALMALQSADERCLCQLIGLLELSPSTVSKHMDLLRRAGLVVGRKQGRWHYFRLAGREGSPPVRQALKWVLQAVGDDPTLARDRQRLACIDRQDLNQISADCYP